MSQFIPWIVLTEAVDIADPQAIRHIVKTILFIGPYYPSPTSGSPYEDDCMRIAIQAAEEEWEMQELLRIESSDEEDLDLDEENFDGTIDRPTPVQEYYRRLQLLGIYEFDRNPPELDRPESDGSNSTIMAPVHNNNIDGEYLELGTMHLGSSDSTITPHSYIATPHQTLNTFFGRGIVVQQVVNKVLELVVRIKDTTLDMIRLIYNSFSL